MECASKICPGEIHQAIMQPGLTVALLPWGDLIEYFLDGIGVSLEAFCKEMTGGWLFSYIDALRLVGVHTVVFCVSARVKAPIRFTNVPTGSTICVLPALKSYHSLRRRMLKPYGWTVEETFGEVQGIRRRIYAILRNVVPYLATPLGLLAREIRRERCKAILCQEYEYARFDTCVALGKVLSIPVFATFQGGYWHLSRFEDLLRPLTMKACTGLIIAPQTEVNRVLAKYGVPSFKIARIFNPIDLTMWGAVDHNETRAALEIPSASRVVVWHGRVDIYRKGLDILLDAWKRVCNERTGQDLRLLLVGTGNDADELHRRIKAMQLQGVMWIDKYLLDRGTIRRYLSAADVYILSSRHEGFPVAPVEAMACSLPVVAADAPGVSDIFEGGEAAGGIVVPRGDAAALALALGRVLDDPAWACELGMRARRRVESCFSLEAVGKQLRDFLSDRGLAITESREQVD